MAEPDFEATETVGERLLASSRSFARSAAAAYSTESWDVFYLHLATAVEQLAKSVLAAAHPSLIADPRANFDSLLHLCGLGDKAQTPDYVSAVRTINVTTALERVGRLIDDYRPPNARVRLVVETRNGIVHAGRQGKAEAEAVLGEVARYLGQLLTARGISSGEYWGEAADMVADHANRRLTALEASYMRRLQAARTQYAQLASSMDKKSLDAFITAVTPTGPSDAFDSVPAPCPCCGHAGVLSGSPEPSWEPDWDTGDGQVYLAGVYVSSVTVEANAFHCRCCGLHLGPEELIFADLERLTLMDGDFDSHAANTFFTEQLAQENWDEY